MDIGAGILRAVLAALGGWLVQKGWIDGGTAETLTGAAVVLGVGIWSIIQKVRAGKATKAAVAAVQ